MMDRAPRALPSAARRPGPRAVGADPGRVPRHVALVTPDSLARVDARAFDDAGPNASADAMMEIVAEAAALGVEFLSVQDPSERVFRRLVTSHARTLDDLEVRVRILGEPDTPLAEIARATVRNVGLTLNVASRYDGRRELVRAIRALATDVRAGRRAATDVSDETIASYLDTAGMPDPDLVICVGGDLRVADFLLFQIAYSEFWSAAVTFPDFRATHFREALRVYAKRQRRFGG